MENSGISLMKRLKLLLKIFVFWLCALSFSLFSQEVASVKVKVIVDSATVKVTPEIDGETLARIPLNTVLDSQEKQGEWYKVTFEKEGLQISGFIHEMLVKVMTEKELAAEEERSPTEAIKTQLEVIHEIQSRLTESRQLIRQENNYEKAIASLTPLIAKAFRVEDHQEQREMAAEIFLWIGMAYEGQGNHFQALQEFRNMFEVNHAYAKEITRNILDPKIMGLIEQAEKEFLGLITEYTLRISSEPNQAQTIVDGKPVGLTPTLYSSGSPKVSVEIKKEGYRTVKEEIFLTQVNTDRAYFLERLGRNLEVKSRPQGARVLLNGEDTGKLTDCVLSYVPFGLHKLKIIKENYAEWEDSVDIQEGEKPLSIDAILTGRNYAPFRKWGAANSGMFQNPTGLALDTEGFLYVVDDSDEKVKRVNADGKIIRNWASGGKDFKNLKSAWGITVDSQGYVYVTDVKKHSVMKFNNQGQFIKKWGKEGKEAAEFQSPLGIAADSNNDIYVVDSLNHCIKKFSNLGVLKKTWGKRGSLDGELLFPVAVSVSAENEVFVLDRIRLQKFSSEGDFLAAWGAPGSNDGEFDKPMGVYIDADGYVYVADSGNNRVQKFGGNGRFISQWGKAGSAEGQFNYPVSIVVDSQGNVYVAERDNNRIQVFKVLSD
jgi:CRISPR/Cas system-associated exonuclease Cas4 (RecB family)